MIQIATLNNSQRHFCKEKLFSLQSWINKPKIGQVSKCVKLQYSIASTVARYKSACNLMENNLRSNWLQKVLHAKANRFIPSYTSSKSFSNRIILRPITRNQLKNTFKIFLKRLQCSFSWVISPLFFYLFYGLFFRHYLSVMTKQTTRKLSPRRFNWCAKLGWEQSNFNDLLVVKSYFVWRAAKLLLHGLLWNIDEHS